MPDVAVLVIAAAITSVFAFKYLIVYLGLREIIAQRIARQRGDPKRDTKEEE